MIDTGILIIDDEKGVRSSLSSILEDEQYRVFTVEDALQGLETLGKEAIGLVFLDVLLPKLGGLEALERIRKEFPEVEVVMISGHANIEMAVRAVKLGAFDFLEKPLALERVLTVVRNAFTVWELREENRSLRRKALPPDEEIIGTSPEIGVVRTLILHAAATDARILITGENGSGKELAARGIHRNSGRADKPFVEVNCAAIPDTLIESELFGHERGAFTDAFSTRKGRFEMAHQGTLFLDEIADMSLSAQAKVLRAIQEGTIERLGGEKTIHVDVRIIAATNQDLEKACREGRFRQDLFFRLNVIPIRIPPLRERQEDIPLILFHILKEFLGGRSVRFDEDALKALKAYPWPGNIRELRNFAERIRVLYPGGAIGLSQVEELLRGSRPSSSPYAGVTFSLLQANSREDLGDMKFNEAKEFFEKSWLGFQFNRNGGIINKTAEAIGMYPSNLHAKLRKYGISNGQGKTEGTI
jgi:two-component system nitrogen regulation response regulator NtrX